MVYIGKKEKDKIQWEKKANHFKPSTVQSAFNKKKVSMHRRHSYTLLVLLSISLKHFWCPLQSRTQNHRVSFTGIHLLPVHSSRSFHSYSRGRHINFHDSPPQPRREMPLAFLQVTFSSFLFWQEHLSASEHTWNVCDPKGQKTRQESEQFSPTSLKKQEYFCFLKQTSNLPENCSLSPNNCSEVAHLEDKQHQFPKPVRQCDLSSLTFTKTTMKIWNLRRNIVTPSSSTYHRPVLRSVHILWWSQWNDTPSPAFV